jgi:hypothetical protein
MAERNRSPASGLIPRTGVAAIELADRIGTKSTAIREGKRRDQIAVYDLDEEKTIMTGGSGRR